VPWGWPTAPVRLCRTACRPGTLRRC